MEAKLRRTRLGSVKRKFGIGPEKRFPWRYKFRRSLRAERSEGSGPERALKRRERVWSLERLPRVLVGS